MKLALKLVDGQNPVGAKHYRNNLQILQLGTCDELKYLWLRLRSANVG